MAAVFVLGLAKRRALLCRAQVHQQPGHGLFWHQETACIPSHLALGRHREGADL